MNPPGHGGRDAAPRNPYCEAVRIDPFRLELVRAPKGLKLFHWMVLAILESGRPMTIDELVARLRQVGVLRPDEDGHYAISKAWHGLAPVYKAPDGRYGLNATGDAGVRLWALADDAGLTRVATVAAPSEPDVVLRPDHEPLTHEELDAAFRDAQLGSAFSPMRQAAAVLDANGEPRTIGQVDEYLNKLTRYRRPLAETGLGRSQSTMVRVDADERLVLDRTGWDVKAMRQAVRQRALPRLRRRAREVLAERSYQAHRIDRQAREARERSEAAALRRVIVRVVPHPTKIQAASLLDVNARSLRTFVGDELSQLAGALQTYGLIAGLHVRDTLAALGLDPDRFRIVDLQPPQKTKQLNRSGRKLTITIEMIIAHTCGISRPLGDPKKVAEYLRSSDHRKLAARLESDVKALFALYNYGTLHRSVRLRWGFLDESLHVDWALEGDPSLYEILQQACDEKKPVEVVVGSAPGWADPWARTQRFEVVKIDFHQVVVRQGGEQFVLARDEVQAVRIAS